MSSAALPGRSPDRSMGWWLRQLGLPGLLGLGLIGGAAWVHRVWLPTQRVATESLESDARRLRFALREAASGAASAASRPVDLKPDQAWQVLWRGLPTADQATSLQDSVLASARAAGLSIQSVQYRGAREGWLPKDGGGLWRQRMTMPVEGSYPAVRVWIAQLRAQPALSVDTLDIQRPDVTGDQVKVQVSLSLWWRLSKGAR